MVVVEWLKKKEEKHKLSSRLTIRERYYFPRTTDFANRRHTVNCSLRRLKQVQPSFSVLW